MSIVFSKKLFLFFFKKVLTNSMIHVIILSEGKGESLQERNQPLVVRWKLPQASKSPPLCLTIDTLHSVGQPSIFCAVARTNVRINGTPRKCSLLDFSRTNVRSAHFVLYVVVGVGGGLKKRSCLRNFNFSFFNYCTAVCFYPHYSVFFFVPNEEHFSST